MKVLHIVPGIDPRSGGPTRSITGLCRALAQAGVDTTLFVQWPQQHLEPNLAGAHFLAGGGRGFAKIWLDTAKVMRQIKPDVVHLHALWMPAIHIAVLVAQTQKVPIMLSVRGNLDPWALRQKAFKKKIALWCYQRKDLLAVACFHATAEQEAANIRGQGLTQPIRVIPNGINLPETLPARILSGDKRRVALFLSRLHPGKGLMNLVNAWAQLRPYDWQLRIVGPDVCGHKAVVQAEIRRLGLQNDVEFVGELDDVEKWQEYVNADLFVHPSHSENFGISIAEALAAGVPVIATKGAPWSELLGSEITDAGKEAELGGGTGSPEKKDRGTVAGNQASVPKSLNGIIGRCGWWIEIGVEPLAQALKDAFALDRSALALMGRNGQRLVEIKYAWPAIAQQMKLAYERIAKGPNRDENNA